MKGKGCNIEDFLRKRDNFHCSPYFWETGTHLTLSSTSLITSGLPFPGSSPKHHPTQLSAKALKKPLQETGPVQILIRHNKEVKG